jgi:hypothetical protein
MAGKKPITLINGNGKPINQHYCYKIPIKAIFRAVQLPNTYVQVWDNDAGKELCYVTKNRNSITIAKV